MEFRLISSSLAVKPMIFKITLDLIYLKKSIVGIIPLHRPVNLKSLSTDSKRSIDGKLGYPIRSAASLTVSLG